MKFDIAGLRKRETYDELIDTLDKDPIKKYPNRLALNLENSPYLSQLGKGHDEIVEQNEIVNRERTKEVLLQTYAATSDIPIAALRHQQTQTRQTSTSSGQTQTPPPDNPIIHNDYQTHRLSSGEVTRYHFKGTQHFDIATNYDDAIDQQADFDIDDATMEEQQQQTKKRQFLDSVQEQQQVPTVIPQPSSSSSSLPVPATEAITAFDEEMKQVHQKRGNENNTSDRAKAKAKAAPALALGPPPEPPKAKTKQPQQSSSSGPAPSPEATPEPKTKQSKNTATAETQKPPKKTVKTDNITKPKPTPAVHGTTKTVVDSVDEWLKHGKGFLIDQCHLRKIPLTKTQLKQSTKAVLADKLLKFDGKI
jgi:hypothetical protein